MLSMLKHIKQKEILPWILLLGGYLLTRFYNLLLLPLFTDESIYIYWAKVISSTHSQWFISLTDGKPPLLIWMISFFLSLFPDDWYLLAGRLPSVFAGLIALIAITKTAELLFSSRRAGIIAGILYIFCPMTLFYDRMALFDSMLTAMLLVSVYFALRTGKERELKDAVLWGFFLGLAFLSKPTALVFLPLTILAAGMGMPFPKLRMKWQKISVLSVLAILIGYGINSMQRISSAYPAMVRKNQQFQQPLSELLSNPFALTFGNLQGFFGWMSAYFTVPFFLFGIGAFCYGLLKKPRVSLLLVILWFVPLLALATVGREIFPRYILIVVPYFLIMAAYAIDKLLQVKGIKKYATFSFLFLLLLPLIGFNYYLLTDPPEAPLPIAEANQYILEHPSGYGLAEVYGFIRHESQHEKVTVVTQGTFGLYPYAFYLEFWGDPNVAILPKWPLDSLDQEIYDAKRRGKVFVILKEHETVPQALPLRTVFSAEKPGGAYPILVTTLDDTP